MLETGVLVGEELELSSLEEAAGEEIPSEVRLTYGQLRTWILSNAACTSGDSSHRLTNLGSSAERTMDRAISSSVSLVRIRKVI